MAASDFQIDLRDIRFVLFEHLPFDRLTTFPGFASLDRESLMLVLEESAKFSREEIAPLNRVGDREGAQFSEGKVKMPTGFRRVYRTFCDAGWLAATTESEGGGMGLPYTAGIAVGEMHVGACCSLALAIGLTHAAANLIECYASDAVKQTYLPKLLSGEWQGTMCLTEPQAGTAVGDIKTMAHPEGDHWLIRGTKIFITAGDHDMTDNHVHLVLARTPGAPKGFKGISLFLVPKYRPSASGGVGEFNDVVTAGIEHKMGINASPTCTLQFGDDGKCRGWLIGEVGAGLQQMFFMMNRARIGVAMQGLALGSQAYLYARAYAAERVQGVDIEQMKNPDAPRVTINEHPHVRSMLLWCKAMVEGSRALIYKTAFYSDLAHHSTDAQEAETARAIVEFLTPVCKAYVSDRGFDVTRHAMQVLGGYGYLHDYPVEQHLRDVKIASIYEGTNGVQALDLLGRKLSQKNGALFRALLGEIDRFLAAQSGHLALADDMKAFASEVERFKSSTMALGARGMSGDRRYPVLCADIYLEFVGNVVTAWLLLEQAVVAHDKLQALYIDLGAFDSAARQKLHVDHADAQFYFNKIEAARYFVYHILSGNQALAARIDSGDRSALTYVP